MSNKKPQHPKPMNYADYINEAVEKGSITKKEGIQAKLDSKKKFNKAIKNLI